MSVARRRTQDLIEKEEQIKERPESKYHFKFNLLSEGRFSFIIPAILLRSFFPLRCKFYVLLDFCFFSFSFVKHFSTWMLTIGECHFFLLLSFHIQKKRKNTHNLQTFSD